MRILIVANHNSGAFSPFVVEQTEALRKIGVTIDFYGIHGKGTLGYLSNLTLLKQKIKQYKPDLIHAHYGLSGLLATLQSKVPVIITFHNGETLSRPINFLCSIGALRAKYVIYVAQHIRDLSYYKNKEYSIIPCGVALEEIQPTPYDTARNELGFRKDTKYILFGGSFDNLRKNYPLLKEAIELMPNKGKIKCLEMKGLNRKQVTQLMCAVDCFALPSKSEGSPQALKEAMACNCPIVATDIADVKHLLGDVTGHYLCTFSPEDVAVCLNKAFDFNKRTEGRKRIIQLGLSNESVAKRIASIYSAVLTNT